MRGLTGLDEFREAKDEFFRRSPDSPLDHEQRHHFSGLSYFPPNDALRLEVALDPSGSGTAEEIEMSDGSSERMVRAGRFSFAVDGRSVGVTAFRSEADRSLFVPFRDATGGTDTYPSGRYVEAEPMDEGRWVLDFNRAYNPYCAYNDAWRCPLPPRENWLDVEIRAGEKRFHD